jgi:hypothetical protein
MSQLIEGFCYRIELKFINRDLEFIYFSQISNGPNIIKIYTHLIHEPILVELFRV